MEKHSHGPWCVNVILKDRIIGDETSPRFDKLQINNSNCTIATVYRADDARLIATAPEMLDVLERIVRDTLAQNSDWAAAARCAIANAKGGK